MFNGNEREKRSPPMRERLLLGTHFRRCKVSALPHRRLRSPTNTRRRGCMGRQSFPAGGWDRHREHEAIFKLFYYKTQHELTTRFPVFANAHIVEQSAAKYRHRLRESNSYEDFSPLRVTEETCHRQWHGDRQLLQPAGPEHRTVPLFPPGLKSTSMADGQPTAGIRMHTETRRPGGNQPRRPTRLCHYFLFLGFSSSAALRRKM